MDESLAVGQFTRRGGRPSQRRLAETNFFFPTGSDVGTFTVS